MFYFEHCINTFLFKMDFHSCGGSYENPVCVCVSLLAGSVIPDKDLFIFFSRSISEVLRAVPAGPGVAICALHVSHLGGV